MVKTITLFLLTGIAEILGCYLPYLWLKEDKPVWLLIPGAISLSLFAWLLTLHDTPFAGRTYAAYGGVYVAMALFWLWIIEGQRPDQWDLIGVGVVLVGVGIIVFSPHKLGIS